MTETEKMEAMKRAYAEMILNTAKEAAERVMTAELRARRSEQELFSVKEEAANMLLRLKQMIDAKTKEAEVTSTNQKKIFEVLECQLNEAEGIILDLREELNQGQEQLYKLKKRQVPVKTHEEEYAEEFSLTPEVECNGYEILTSAFNPGPKQALCAESNVYSGNNSTGFGQTNEPETSLVEETISVVDKVNQSRNCSNVEGVNAAKTTALDEKDRNGNIETVSIVRRSVRKRKLKFWDDVITACGLKPSHQLKKSRHASTDLSCLVSRQIKRCVKNGEDLAGCGTKIENHNDAEVLREVVTSQLIDVLVKPDELAATSELTSASRIDCDVEDSAADEASNLSDADDDKFCKYTLNSKWRRKKSVIFPEKVLDKGS